MNTGMQDAFNLAWKLALVIGGVCKRARCSTATRVERSAVGDMVLRNASRLTDAAVVRNPILQGLRNTVVKFALGFPSWATVWPTCWRSSTSAIPRAP